MEFKSLQKPTKTNICLNVGRNEINIKIHLKENTLQ